MLALQKYRNKKIAIYGMGMTGCSVAKALKKLKDGTYGFCEETGEPIGLKRLIARPIATLSIEAQERHEKEEKIYIEN